MIRNVRKFVSIESFIEVLIQMPFLAFLFFGFWTLGCHFSVYRKASYINLDYVFWEALFGAVIVFILLRNQLKFSDSRAHLNHRVFTVQHLYFLLVVGSLLFIAVLSGKYVLVWLVLSVSATFIFFLCTSQNNQYCKSKLITTLDDQTSQECSRPTNPTLLLCGLLGVTLLAVFVTIFFIRIDNDDAYYLSIVTQALDEPNLPVLYYETMYGVHDVMMAAMRRMHTYELLVATFSQIFTINHLTVYYVIFPICTCILLVLSYFYIYRRWLKSDFAALIGVAITVCILILWGDANRTFGNFAFVRLFQGKCIMIQLFIPMAMFLTWETLLKKQVSSALLLSICSIGAVGMSVNAILILPVAIAFASLGCFIGDHRKVFSIRSILLISMACLYPIAIALVIKLNPGGDVVQHFGRTLSSHLPDTNRIIGIVLGKNSLNFRSTVALSALVLFPLVLTHKSYQRSAAGFVFITTLFLLTPGYPLHHFFAKYASSNLIWRLTWIIPFPLIIGGAFGAIANARNKPLFFVIPLILFLFACTPQSWTISKSNRSQFGFQNHKFNEVDFQGVKDMHQYLPITGKVLAPENLAFMMIASRDHPPLAYVRKAYLRRFSAEKEKNHLLLKNTVEIGIYNRDIERFTKLLDELKIHSIVFVRKNGIKKPELIRQLTKRGFRPAYQFRHYHLWIKPE